MLPDGTDISAMLQSEGPIVKCVILRVNKGKTNDGDTKKPAEETEEAKDTSSKEENKTKRIVLTDLMDEIEIDTTPQKQGVAAVLGGKFTFVGQYEDEGIVLMARNVEGMDPMDLPPFNPHVLQPPLDEAEVRGDIVIMKVAATEEELDSDDDEDDDNGKEKDDKKSEEKGDEKNEEKSDGESKEKKEEKDVVVPTNDEFFLDYTKKEFIAFASRTDVVAPEQPDEEDEEESSEEENGEEEEEDDDEDGEYNIDGDADEEEERTGIMNLLMRSILRKFTEDNGRGPNTEELLSIRDALADKMGVTLADIPSQDEPSSLLKRKLVVLEPNDPKSPYKSILRREDEDCDDDDDDDDVEEVQPSSKRVKFGEGDKEATILLFTKDSEEEKKGDR